MPPAFLFDLDGTLYTDEGPVPGAVEAIEELRRRGTPVRFVTNTTRTNRRALISRLASYGFRIGHEELFTPAVAAVALCRERGVGVVAPFVARELLEDLNGLELAGGVVGASGPRAPEAVLLADLGDAWTPALLNEAFRHVLNGALFVVLQKGRYWMGATGLELDAGAFAAAIEYATGKQALECGKPCPAFYQSVLAGLELTPPAGEVGRVVMVGDDLWNDVEGARKAGLEGWLVRTGKFREDVLASSGLTPDRVLGSVSEVI
ncbi:MAG: HAD-IIA family hydrolase [Gemmatimonadetes bacterium]|nr:HAD-IIA family hydrolase [Gemmatimonadota bacterium]